jgi:uncharacterized OB-fold protein
VNDVADRRPLPQLTPENRAFWTGGEHGRLMIHRCAACSHWIHPPSPICPQCRGRDVSPQAASGRATVATFTVNRQAWRPTMNIPFVVAIVELDEQPGLRLTTNIVNIPPDDVGIGQRVRVVFEQHDDIWLPLFEPFPPVR